MTVCRTCGENKPVEHFYASTTRASAETGECKSCVKLRVRRRARTDPKVREYDRERAKSPQRREIAAIKMGAWREKNPDAYKAQTAVSNAIRDGRLSREPCLFCERTDVHAHHRDYSRPLDVVWLCPKCHHRLHANFPETEGANKASAPF